MARPTLEVLPGFPDTPQTVAIDCSEMDTTKTLEFLVNDKVRGTIPVEITGLAVLNYLVPAGQVRNALADFGSCTADFSTPVPDGEYFCKVSTGLGDSMGLRYKV